MKKNEGKAPQTVGPSRRQQKRKRFIQEIDKLKKAYKEAPAEEKDGIS